MFVLILSLVLYAIGLYQFAIIHDNARATVSFAMASFNMLFQMYAENHWKRKE